MTEPNPIRIDSANPKIDERRLYAIRGLTSLRELEDCVTKLATPREIDAEGLGPAITVLKNYLTTREQ
jgi:hypothetical protein